MKYGLFFALLFFHLSAYAEEIRVGVIAPLSGPVATWGEDVRNSLQFAQAHQGLSNIKLIFEDDQCLGKNAATAAQKLISIDKVDFAMVVCTEALLSSAPIFERAKVVVISPITSGASISKAGDYIFRTWPSDALAAKMLADYMAAHHKRIGVLSEERGFAEELAKAFVEAAGQKNLTLVSESFPTEMLDFRSVLARMRQKGIDGFFLNTESERSMVNLLRQLRGLDPKLSVYGVYLPGNAAVLKEAADLVEGAIFVDAPSAPEALTTEGQKLFGEFTAKFGTLQSTSFVFASSYEALKLVAVIVKSGTDARQFLYNGKFNGIFGPYEFDSNGDIQGVKHVLKIIRHGKKEILP